MTKFFSCLIMIIGMFVSLNTDVPMEKMGVFMMCTLTVILLQVTDINNKMK